ncbi:DNA-binding protein H-NS [Sporomusa ovata]|uniref:DNA-binding protein H-NS n=2 Tax=Sporomusa ovata TaxID=2378 RepID=A0A0U1L7G0_9FIRM|nr:DNA-binding protein H-NS [Sporomusa ovata]
MPHDPKAPLQLLAGGGTYSGRWAAAVGVGFYAHEKFLLKFGMAFCASEKMGQLGLEWKWGRSGKKAAVAQDGSSTVTALQATARQLQDQIKQQQEKTKKQQDQQQDQIKQLQDQIKQLLNTQENPS